MLAFVTGPPGSGKTLYAVEAIVDALSEGKEVWTNVELVKCWSVLLAMRGWRRWMSDSRIESRAAWLREHYHFCASVEDFPSVRARESSRLVVIDEAQLWFNCRDWQKHNQVRAWLSWFSQHRKFGCDVLLVTQDAKMVDAQIRSLAEQEIRCWSLVRWSLGFLGFSLPVGWILTFMFGPLMWRRASFVGMPFRLWSEISPVWHSVARLYDTTQIYQISSAEKPVQRESEGSAGPAVCYDWSAA